MRARDHQRDGRTARRRLRGGAGLVALLLLLATGCGDPGSATGAAETSAEEPVDEDPAPDPDEGGEEAPPAGEEPAEEPQGAEAPEGESAPTEEPEGADAPCQLAVGDDAPMSPEQYEELVPPINGELEELVFAMDAALTDLEEGGDGPTLEAELEEHATTWEDLVVPVDGSTPPDGAEDWHDRLVASWVAVCEAIEDGIAGSAEGDDDRFEAFVDALREFPSLYNDLHANAMCGPFEAC